MMFNFLEFVAEEGVRPVPASDETRREALLVSLQSDAAYRVDLAMGPLSMPTALHLPWFGEGTWYIPMRGNLMVISAKELVWDGNV